MALLFGSCTWASYDYQTYHYLHRSVDSFGSLIHWHIPRGDRKFVLVRVKVINLRLVLESLVIHQLRGDRHCWTVCVTMLCSSD